MEKYFTIKEAAEILGVTEDTVREWCKEGQIKANKLKGSGEWRIPESSVRANLTGETPKEEPMESENPEVKKAQDAQKIAEAKAAEAKADEEFKGYKDTEEQRVNDIAEAKEKAIKEATQRLEDAAIRHKEEADASHAQKERYEPENTKLRELGAMQKERIGVLETLVGIKEEEERKLASDTDFYNDHVEQGTLLLTKIAKYISPHQKSLADYLNRQVARLVNGVGYEQGMGIFGDCSRNMIKIASWFFDGAETDKKNDAYYTSLGNYLNEKDESLKVIMRIPWKEGRPFDYPPDREFKENLSNSSSVDHSKLGKTRDRILEKLG